MERPPAVGPAGVAYNIAAVTCNADRAAATVRCGAPVPATGTGALPDIILGGQNVYVALAASNVNYSGGTGQFTFNATLQNLIEQKLGTTDGTTLDANGIRVFFQDGPNTTGGSGSVSVVPDGFNTFLSAGQAYYQYNTVLAQTATSSAKTWTLIMPPTVSTFSFTVYVSAPVQFPSGYVAITGANVLHPDVTEALTSVVRTAVGATVPGALINWSSSDNAVATVDASGVITPLKYGNADISALSGVRPGTHSISVGGTSRAWDGASSTDWFGSGNWPVRGITPTIADTAVIGTGAANMPVLTASTSITALTLQASTSLNLASFDLTVTGFVNTGSSAVTSGTGRLVMPSGTVAGNVPALIVTGTVSAAANVTTTGNIVVTNGTLTNTDFTIQATP